MRVFQSGKFLVGTNKGRLIHNIFEAMPEGVVLTGGFIRDSYYGLPPKDADFMLLDPDISAEQVHDAIAHTLGKDARIERFENLDKYGEVAVKELIKVHLPDITLDIFRTKEEPQDVWEMFDYFDYNFNCFAQARAGEEIITMAPPKRGGVHVINPDRLSFERYKKFKDKFGKVFDWSTAGKDCPQIKFMRNRMFEEEMAAIHVNRARGWNEVGLGDVVAGRAEIAGNMREVEARVEQARVRPGRPQDVDFAPGFRDAGGVVGGNVRDVDIAWDDMPIPDGREEAEEV